MCHVMSCHIMYILLHSDTCTRLLNFILLHKIGPTVLITTYRVLSKDGYKPFGLRRKNKRPVAPAVV